MKLSSVQTKMRKGTKCLSLDVAKFAVVLMLSPDAVHLQLESRVGGREKQMGTFTTRFVHPRVQAFGHRTREISPPYLTSPPVLKSL